MFAMFMAGLFTGGFAALAGVWIGKLVQRGGRHQWWK